MKPSITKTHRIANSKALHIAVFVIAMLSFTLNGWNAQAANVIPTGYRLATANEKFADAWKSMVVFKVRPRRRLRAKRVELAIHRFATSQENRLLVSLCSMQRPLAVHEQNAVAGLTNHLLARLARVALQAFPGSFPANINTKTVASATPIPVWT